MIFFDKGIEIRFLVFHKSADLNIREVVSARTFPYCEGLFRDAEISSCLSSREKLGAHEGSSIGSILCHLFFLIGFVTPAIVCRAGGTKFENLEVDGCCCSEQTKIERSVLLIRSVD